MNNFLKIISIVLLSLAAVPACAQTYSRTEQTYSPAEHLSYEAAVSESVDDYNKRRIQDRDLIRQRYDEEVKSIHDVYAQQVKGIKDRKVVADYKRERDQKLKEAHDRLVAVNNASEDVLQKKLKDRKAYLRTLPFRKK